MIDEITRLENSEDLNKERKIKNKKTSKMPKEIGGPEELEPTRYGDWEKKGITSDF